MAPSSNTSLETMTNQYQQTSQTAVSMGSSGIAAGRLGMASTQMFQDSPSLKGRGGDLISAVLGNDRALMEISGMRGRNELPGAVVSNMADSGDSAEWIDKLLKRWVDLAWQAENVNPSMGAKMLQQRLGSIGFQVSLAQAKEIMELYREGNQVTEASERAMMSSLIKPSLLRYWNIPVIGLPMNSGRGLVMSSPVSRAFHGAGLNTKCEPMSTRI